MGGSRGVPWAAQWLSHPPERVEARDKNRYDVGVDLEVGDEITRKPRRGVGFQDAGLESRKGWQTDERLSQGTSVSNMERGGEIGEQRRREEVSTYLQGSRCWMQHSPLLPIAICLR